ncbi:MAG TPA: hypothetical protein VIK91_15545, partial [Nannocystis sp.]
MLHDPSGPRGADEEQARIAAVLRPILLISAAVAVVTFAVQALVFGTNPAAAIVYPSIALLSAGLLVLVQRGRLRLAGGIFLGLVWLAVTFGALTQSGLRSSSLGGYTLVIIVAALLFRQRWMVAFIGLSVVALTAFLALDLAAVEVPRFTEDAAGIALIAHIIHLGAGGVFLSMTVKGLQSALARARHGEERAAELLREAHAARNYTDNILASMAESLI